MCAMCLNPVGAEICDLSNLGFLPLVDLDLVGVEGVVALDLDLAEDNLFRFSNFLYIVAASFSFGKENPIIDSSPAKE